MYKYWIVGGFGQNSKDIFITIILKKVKKLYFHESHLCFVIIITKVVCKMCVYMISYYIYLVIIIKEILNVSSNYQQFN